MAALRVRGFYAHTAVVKCKEYALKHAQVLAHFGIGRVTSAKTEWWQNDRVYVLVLEEEATGELLGGVRMQRWGNGRPLPIESAISGVDSRVHSWIASFAPDGVAELCGLFTAQSLRGCGLGPVLTMMGLSLARVMRTRTVFAVCDEKGVETNCSYGFREDKVLAEGGRFCYPRPGLTAQVLRADQAGHLPAASGAHRQRMERYRDQPIGEEVLDTPAGVMQLARSLVLPTRIGGPTPAVTPTPELQIPVIRAFS